MIRVTRALEYADFDQQVRKPGQAFLRSTPHPTGKEFRKHNYWTRSAGELMSAYSGNCAYTSLRIVDSNFIDHFRPKSSYPHLAYEWDNFRLARQKINARKGDTEEVADPFEISNGWFQLDVPSCLLKPADDLDHATRVVVNNTINILQLNSDDRLVQERCNHLVDLADDLYGLEYLDRVYPFLAFEVRRQKICSDLKTIFSR